jgi:outer membrane protein assembly factor BamB
MNRTFHLTAAWLALALGGVAAQGAETSPEQAAEAIYQLSGVRGGVVVHVGCGDGRLTAALRANDRYVVHGLDRDGHNVEKARGHIRSLGLYGPVSATQWDGDGLPYADNLVNLIVMEEEAGEVDRREILRVLAPLGVACVRKDGAWETTVKPWPEEIDEWTHYLHGSDNNAVARDLLADMPRSMQWVSAPKWGRSHEELAGISASASARGRIFFIVDEAPLASVRYASEWKLVARDAFNGVLLWKRPISVWTDHLRHFRSGPLHLPRRLVAAGDRVYVTRGLDAAVEALDAATGETIRTFEGTEQTEEILFHDGALYLAIGTSEVDVSGEGLFRRGKPEPSKERHIAAIDAASGRELWRRTSAGDESVLPLTLAARNDRVYFQSTLGLVCLDAASGRELWRTERETVSKRYGWSAPTLVACDDVVLLADRDPSAKGENVSADTGSIGWGVNGWTEKSIPRKGTCVLTAYGAADGKELWSTPAAEGYNSPVDVFVVDDVVWSSPDFSQGRDLRTGEVRKTISTEAAPVGMSHHRCYRNKATPRYIFTGRSGIELIDLEEGWRGNNSWVRGTCQYGIMPCNGMVYAPSNACACFPKAKLPGFNALTAKRRTKDEERRAKNDGRLERGPAYGEIDNLQSKIVDGMDWPTYRHDARRSGATSAEVSPKLRVKWSVDLGDRLTQPVVADGQVLVAATDTHTVHALDLKTGERRWSYTAGGRIDSAPTLYGGLALFGSADGRVTCLRASDGERVWTFLAAPEDRLIGAYNRLESAWPVHGAVLVQNGEAVFAAGRSSYLDGGIRLYRLDPATGEELSRTVVHDLDPETDQQLGKEGAKAGLRFDMEGTMCDVLSGDGERVYMKHLNFDAQGKALSDLKPHLFSITGFLGEEWFVRSFWLYGTETGAGYGGWAKVGNLVPAGRILSFNDTAAYGYGRVQYTGAKAGHRGNTYQFFAMPLDFHHSVASATADKRNKNAPRPKTPSKPYLWTESHPFTARAMTLASDHLIVAGVPDVGVKTEGEPLAFENEREAFDAFTGKQGGRLWVVSAGDGRRLAEYDLEAAPVFDGMAVVRDMVLMSLRNGTLTAMESD